MSNIIYPVLLKPIHSWVPENLRVLDHLQVLDPRIRVTWWLKMSRIRVWLLRNGKPVGSDQDHLWVDSCSALMVSVLAKH